MTTKIEKKLLARLTFVADKMVQNLKKCLDKHNVNDYAQMPAIEVKTGLLMATDGHILAVYKAKDYHCEMCVKIEDCLELDKPILLPLEITNMSGVVTVEIFNDGYTTIVSVHDENDICGKTTSKVRFPKWRSAVPWSSGWSFDVKAKAWGNVLKEMQKEMGNSNKRYPMRVYGEKSKDITLSCYNDEMNETWERDVKVDGGMPYKVSASFNCKKLRDVMSFQPTAMRFYDSSKAVMFYNSETLILLMPLYDACSDVPSCKIDKRDIEVFDFDKWLGSEAVQKPVLQPETTPLLSLADRLRAALKERMAA